MKKSISFVFISIFSIIVFIIIIPLLIALAINTTLIVTDTSNGWIGFWGSYLGGLIGGVISGSITLFVMMQTLAEGKKERKLMFCNDIVSACSAISNGAAEVTLKTQDFLLSTKKKDQTEAILYKNKLLDDIWKLVVKLEAKRGSYSGAQELYNDVIQISTYINSFSINNLNYTDESSSEDIINGLVKTENYKQVNNDCQHAADKIKNAVTILEEHLKFFYNENTKQIL